MEKLGYSVDELTKVLPICRTKAFALIKNGTLETVLVGGRRIVKASSVRRLLEEEAV